MIKTYFPSMFTALVFVKKVSDLVVCESVLSSEPPIEIFYFYYYENSCTCRKENLENIKSNSG
jgi:hypothetical protein